MLVLVGQSSTTTTSDRHGGDTIFRAPLSNTYTVCAYQIKKTFLFIIYIQCIQIYIYIFIYIYIYMCVCVCGLKKRFKDLLTLHSLGLQPSLRSHGPIICSAASPVPCVQVVPCCRTQSLPRLTRCMRCQGPWPAWQRSRKWCLKLG